MRGTKAKKLRSVASEQGLTEKGYTRAMDGSVHCIGFRSVYKQLKKKTKRIIPTPKRIKKAKLV